MKTGNDGNITQEGKQRNMGSRQWTNRFSAFTDRRETREEEDR